MEVLMSNESIAPTQKNSNDWNFINRSDRTFAAMIPDLTLAEIDNPRRFVSHPSGWRFVVEVGCFGPIVLAAAPHHRLDCASCLVDGPAAIRGMELLEVVV